MKKYIGTNKLRDILRTVNTRIVKEIEIKECSNHIPFKLGWCEIKIASNIYVVDFWDQDERYTEDAILDFNQMLVEFDYLNILYYKGIRNVENIFKAIVDNTIHYTGPSGIIENVDCHYRINAFEFAMIICSKKFWMDSSIIY